MNRTPSIPKKFLLDILGMTNDCNLHCHYCDWEKTSRLRLEQSHLNRVKIHLRQIRALIDIYYPEIQIVEYAGGEPYVYPQICEAILDTFKDKWVRLITNGSLLSDRAVSIAKDHGKVVFAVSLDGYTDDSNYARFYGNKKILYKVLANVNKIVLSKIPLMLLCTINKYNIDTFFSYVKWLETNYENAVIDGMIVMPAHYVISYTKDNGTPGDDQRKAFITMLEQHRESYLLLSRISHHYRILQEVLYDNARQQPCTIFKWALSMHFRGRSLIDHGDYVGFGCGMRGNMMLGCFNINSQQANLKFFDRNNDLMIPLAFNTVNNSYNQCQNYCFVDWVAIDRVLNGEISLETAAEWFVMFKDPNIIDFVKRYTQMPAESAFDT